MAGWNISREVAQLPLREGIVPQFVMYAVASTVSQNWLSERAKGATYTGVNIADLRQLPLPLPSWDEQRVIVSRVEALLRIADVVASRVGAASSRIEHLVPAILSKAFAGELVPTEAELARAGGRSYETAEELLARIRSPHQNPCEEAPEPSRRASRRRRREAAQVGSRRTRY
jgi:type I restriction enzyme S subunit